MSDAKHWWLPKARGGKQVFAEHGRRFLADEANRAMHDALSHDDVAPGYRAPRTPAEMTAATERK